MVRVAVPAIAQSLLHTVVFLVDRAMLGRYSEAALASMQISGPVSWSTWSVLTAFSVGAIALIGRAVGAHDRPLAVAAARASVAWAFGAGVVAGIVGTFGVGAILAAFPASGEAVRAAADGYLTVVFAGLPLLMVSYTCASVFAAVGDTRTPFVVAALGNVLNVALNWALIFGNAGAPELGATGAAVGSVAAMALQSVLMVALLWRGRPEIGLAGRGGEWEAFRRMFRVAGAAFGERVVQHVGFLGFVAMIGALGSVAMAANQALISLESICFLSADGFGIAAAAVVAQRLGAKRPDAAALAGWIATLMGTGLLVTFGLLFLLLPEPLLYIFTDDGGIVAEGLPCLVVAAAAQPFMAVGIVLSQALRGAGETRAPLVVTLVGGLVVRLVATWFLAFELDLGLFGVWLGSTADWIVRAAMLAWVFVRGRWREAAV